MTTLLRFKSMWAEHPSLPRGHHYFWKGGKGIGKWGGIFITHHPQTATPTFVSPLIISFTPIPIMQTWPPPYTQHIALYTWVQSNEHLIIALIFGFMSYYCHIYYKKVYFIYRTLKFILINKHILYKCWLNIFGCMNALLIWEIWCIAQNILAKNIVW